MFTKSKEERKEMLEILRSIEEDVSDDHHMRLKHIEEKCDEMQESLKWKFQLMEDLIKQTNTRMIGMRAELDKRNQRFEMIVYVATILAIFSILLTNLVMI